MKYKQYSFDELEEIGEGSITRVFEALLSTGMVEVFTNLIRDLDNTSDKKLQFEYQKEFDYQPDSQLVIYHLICYFAALLRLRSVHYIKTKRIFSGYLNDPDKIASYTLGLQNGLVNYQKIARIDELQTAKPRVVDGKFIYDEKVSLDRVPIPYFYDVDYGENNYADLSNSLAQLLGLIREPANVEGSGVPFQHLIKDLDLHGLAITFLEAVFLRN